MSEPASSPSSDARTGLPLVFAHRGASGYRPDHTRAAYGLASSQGADYIEPDLVMTSDGYLVARHDLDLGPTTDASSRFPGGSTTREVEGEALTAWFADDFSLDQIRTLRARQPRAERSQDRDGLEGVMTWPEILDLATDLAQTHGSLGLVPELKHPTYLRSRGLDPVAPFLEALNRSGFPHERVWVQCFEPGALRELRSASDLRLVQLIGTLEARPADGGLRYGEMLTREGLAEVATWAHAIGVSKRHLLPLDAEGRYLEATSVLADAHAAGLQVHVYTFRDEPDARPSEDATAVDELKRFYALGVDAVFADHPDTAVIARQ